MSKGGGSLEGNGPSHCPSCNGENGYVLENKERKNSFHCVGPKSRVFVVNGSREFP